MSGAKPSRRLPLPPWPAISTERGPGGRLRCRCGCGVEVAPPRRSWATPECLERTRLRCDWSVVRKHVYELGRGLCAVCGCHPESLRAVAREALLEGNRAVYDRARAEGWPRLARVWYEIDHVTPVVEGGAEHGRKNLRVLCYRCHVAHTTAQNRARRAAKLAATDAAPATPIGAPRKSRAKPAPATAHVAPGTHAKSGRTKTRRRTSAA